MSPGDLLTDSYYEKHWLSFPPSWNDKYAIPVLVIDPSGIPNKKYVLALDEIILAFWKMVDNVCMLKGLAQKHGNAGSAAVVSKAEQALADARRLQRNAPFYWHYSTTDKAPGALRLVAGGCGDVVGVLRHCGVEPHRFHRAAARRFAEEQRGAYPHLLSQSRLPRSSGAEGVL